MPIDLDAAFSGGGRPLLGLLNYCVISVRLDPLFVFLVGDFRTRPTSSGAVALYNVFLGPKAPVRNHAGTAIPRNDLRLSAAIEPFRQSLLRYQEMRQQDPDEAVPPLIPPQYFFDAAALEVRRHPRGAFQKVAREYDPARSALENLPGGKMNVGQRAFVDREWRPDIRPYLVAAGFWRISSVG